jgi:hypothetical protein
MTHDLHVHFEVPTRGCVSLMNSIQEVFEVEGRNNPSIEHDDVHRTATITVTIPDRHTSCFVEWATIRGFMLNEEAE